MDVDWNVWHWFRLPSLSDWWELRNHLEWLTNGVCFRVSQGQQALVRQNEELLQRLRNHEAECDAKWDKLGTCVDETRQAVETACRELRDEIREAGTLLSRMLQANMERELAMLDAMRGKVKELRGICTKGLVDSEKRMEDIQGADKEILSEMEQKTTAILGALRVHAQQLRQNGEEMDRKCEEFFAKSSMAVGSLAKQADCAARQIDEFISIAAALRETFDLFLVNSLADQLETSLTKSGREQPPLPSRIE